MKNSSLRGLLLSAAVLAIAALPATAGNIYLTGHDVLLHSDQNGYSNVILDYLREANAAGSYRIGLVRGNEGFASTDVLGGATYGGLTTYSLDTATAASFSAFLSSIDVLVVPSHENCGGCDLSTADADVLAGFSSQIASFFNAGGDIWANSGADDATFYQFLPPSAVASGLPISGSSGFTATPAGVAIGILPDMINGFQTHNRFTSFTSGFTVYETRGDEVISIGLRGGTITDGGITVPGGDVPEPGTTALLGGGLAALALLRKKFARRGI